MFLCGKLPSSVDLSSSCLRVILYPVMLGPHFDMIIAFEISLSILFASLIAKKVDRH
jgi:hypothetical protein